MSPSDNEHRDSTVPPNPVEEEETEEDTRCGRHLLCRVHSRGGQVEEVVQALRSVPEGVHHGVQHDVVPVRPQGDAPRVVHLLGPQRVRVPSDVALQIGDIL